MGKRRKYFFRKVLPTLYREARQVCMSYSLLTQRLEASKKHSRLLFAWTAALPSHRSPWTRHGRRVFPRVSRGRSSRGRTLPYRSGSIAASSGDGPWLYSSSSKADFKVSIKNSSQDAVNAVCCGTVPLQVVTWHPNWPSRLWSMLLAWRSARLLQKSTSFGSSSLSSTNSHMEKWVSASDSAIRTFRNRWASRLSAARQRRVLSWTRALLEPSACRCPSSSTGGQLALPDNPADDLPYLDELAFGPTILETHIDLASLTPKTHTMS